MNSLQKRPSSKHEDSHETFLSTFEKNILTINDIGDVEIMLKKLQFVGTNFDPFMPEISDECQQVMDNLGLTQHMKNPYLATNIILRLLDKTEERLNTLKQ